MITTAFSDWPSHGAIAAIIVILVFGTTTLVYLAILGYYIANVVTLPGNYHVVARGPALTAGEIGLNGAVVTIVSLREIFEVVGLPLPCPIMAFVSVAASVALPALFVLRSLRFVVLFDPKLRRRWMRQVSQRRMVAFVATLLLVPAILALVMAYEEHKWAWPLCVSQVCLEANCLYQSMYYVTTPLTLILLLLFTLAVRRILMLPVEDNLLQYRDMINSVTAYTVLHLPYMLVVVLLDVGVMADTRWWSHLLTAFTIVGFATLFVVDHLVPSYRLGYSPFDFEQKESKVAPTEADVVVAGSSKKVAQYMASSSNLEDGITIRDILDMPILRDLFTDFCALSHCEEIMQFLAEAQAFKAEVTLPDPWTAILRMRAIYDRFLKTNAEDEINISSGMKANLMAAVEAYMMEEASQGTRKASAATLLDPACEEMKTMLGSTVLFNFKKTEEYQVAVGYLMLGG